MSFISGQEQRCPRSGVDMDTSAPMSQGAWQQLAVSPGTGFHQQSTPFSSVIETATFSTSPYRVLSTRCTGECKPGTLI